MHIPIDDEQPWWRYRPVENKGQLTLRSALKKRADDILSRPGARNSIGMLNPRIISREEARIIAQVYPRVAEQQGRPGRAITGFEALGNLGGRALVTGQEAIAETGLAATQALADIGPKGPALLPFLSNAERERRSRESFQTVKRAVTGKQPVGEAITELSQRQRERPLPEQFVAGAVFDPLNLLPGVGYGPEVVRGVKAVSKAAVRGAESALVLAPGEALPKLGLRLAGAKPTAGGAGIPRKLTRAEFVNMADMQRRLREGRLPQREIKTLERLEARHQGWISRQEAIKIAKQQMADAEQGRQAVVEAEATRGLEAPPTKPVAPITKTIEPAAGQKVPIRYARVTTKDFSGKTRRVVLRVLGEDDKILRGIEVDKAGEDIISRAADQRVHVIDKTTIQSISPLAMNRTYGTLERIKTAGGVPTPRRPVTPSTAEAVAPPAAQARAVEQVSVPTRRTRARVTAAQQAPPPTLIPEEVAAGVSPPSPAAAPPIARRPLWEGVTGRGEVQPLRPPIEAPTEGLPSGRRPGGPGRVVPPPPRDPYGMLKASLEPEREPLISRVRTSLPQELYDRNFPLKELEQATGIPTRKAAQVVPGAMAAGEDVVRRFYAPIVKTVEKDLKFLERYMVLMRDSDILSRNPHARLPGGIANEGERQIALTALQKDVGAERFAQLERAAADLWRVNDEQVLRPWLDEGIIDSQMYREMKSAHPHYIPFMRDDFAEVITNSFSARPEANLSTTGIRRMGLEGSERALSNPLLRLLQQPIKAKQTIFRNRAAKSIVRALEELQRQTGEEMVRYIDPKKEMNIVQRVTGEAIPRLKKGEISQQWETISFFENGVKNRVEVPSIYGRVAKGLEAEPDNILLRAARIFNAPLRLGATTFNPFFTPTNIIRDAMSAMFREKVFPFGPDYMAGLWGAIRKNADFSEASQAGALLGGLIDDMSRARILKNPMGGITVKNPWEAITLIPRLIEEMNIIAERGVRIGTFRKLRAEGLDVLEAAVRSRDATVDFAKSGHAMKVINQVLPFTNAAVQGSANIVRTIRDHPARSAAFATMFASVAVMERVSNMRYETSELIPDYEYTRNWVIQFGEGTRADGTKYPIYAKIPKGEIAALFTFVPEALFHLARKSEDRSAVELLLSSGYEVSRAVSPIEIGGVTGLLPPALETGVGLQTGVDPFTGAPLIPERLRGLPPEQQFTRETSQTAIQIGRLFKVSPMLVDFALNDVAAGGGQTLNWLTSMGLEALRVDVEAFGSGDPDVDLAPTGLERLTKERTPGISRFIGTRDTQLVRRGYDNLVDAVVDTNRVIGNFPDVSRLGIKFGQVQGTIGDVELTPQQRARYQELSGQLAIEGLTKLQAGSGYALRTDVSKEKRIRDVFNDAREDARALVLREIREGAQQPVPTPSGAGSSTWERMKQSTSKSPSSSTWERMKQSGSKSSSSSVWDRMKQAIPVGAD